MNSRFNFSLNGKGVPGNEEQSSDDARSFDVQQTEAALSDKFDHLNRKWQAAEQKLRSIVGACNLPVIWITAESNGNSWNYLGFVGDEICYAEGVRKPSPGNWKGILDCSAKIRISAVNHLPKLFEAVQKAVHERLDVLPDSLDKAIEKLSDALEKF